MKRTLEMNVREAAEKGTVLVCMTQPQIDTILAEAERVGVTIETPMLIHEYHEIKMAASTLD